MRKVCFLMNAVCLRKAFITYIFIDFTLLFFLLLKQLETVSSAPQSRPDNIINKNIRQFGVAHEI